MVKKLPTLYSITNKNKIQQWTIEYNTEGYRTIYGQVGGKIQETNWYIAKPTNTGRANARNQAEQAEFEALSVWKKKKEEGYVEDINDIQTTKAFECMLAESYEKRINELVFPLFVQPKLDGARLVSEQNRVFSRHNKEWVAVPHIKDAFVRVHEKYSTIKFDGELYAHELKHDFNQITSIIRKTKPSSEDLELSRKIIKFWVYDLHDSAQPNLTFRERNTLLKKIIQEFSELLDPCVVLVPTYECSCVQEIDEKYNEFLAEGFEGQMIRHDQPYQTKRTKYLLKRKDFQDEEYKILDIVEGEGNKTGMAGFMRFQTQEGIPFKSNIKGNRKYLKELLEKKTSFIGKLATVRYFNKSSDNVPRFPYVYSIRDYE